MIATVISGKFDLLSANSIASFNPVSTIPQELKSKAETCEISSISGFLDSEILKPVSDNLKYWFRGVEKFAPWVNKIYFITYGHAAKR